MGYLQMQLMNETTETSTIGICLNIDKFYADLDFTANSDFEKWDEYPFERFFRWYSCYAVCDRTPRKNELISVNRHTI